MLKRLLCIVFILTSTHAQYFQRVNLAVGAFSEHTREIYKNLDGVKNFDVIPFIKASASNPFIYNHNYTLEFAISFPRSSRDSDVSVMNLWSNFFLEKQFTYLDLQYGFGLYLTRTSMDGKPQTTTNAGIPTTFQTPSGPIFSVNISTTLGVNFHLTQLIDLGFHAMVLNIEDKSERTYNYILSLSYDFGKL